MVVGVLEWRGFAGDWWTLLGRGGVRLRAPRGGAILFSQRAAGGGEREEGREVAAAHFGGDSGCRHAIPFGSNPGA